MKVIGHRRGEKCPRCKKTAFCDDCCLCEACGFSTPPLGNPFKKWPEKMPRGHRQVIVKVSAPVDASIAKLVEALNSIQNVYSIGNCEGKETFFVDFRYLGSVHASADFLVALGTHLAARDMHLLAEWGGGDSLEFRLAAPHSSINELTELLLTFSGARSSSYSYGTRRKVSRSSKARAALRR